MGSKKVQISFDDDLLAEIEAYAKKMHLGRSASVSVLCSTALQSQKAMVTLEELVAMYWAEKDGIENLKLQK